MQGKVTATQYNKNQAIEGRAINCSLFFVLRSDRHNIKGIYIIIKINAVEAFQTALRKAKNNKGVSSYAHIVSKSRLHNEIGIHRMYIRKTKNERQT